MPQSGHPARPRKLAERMGVSRYDDSDRLNFLTDRPGLTLIYAKTEFRWAVVDLETLTCLHQLVRVQS